MPRNLKVNHLQQWLSEVVSLEFQRLYNSQIGGLKLLCWKKTKEYFKVKISIDIFQLLLVDISRVASYCNGAILCNSMAASWASANIIGRVVQKIYFYNCGSCNAAKVYIFQGLPLFELW